MSQASAACTHSNRLGAVKRNKRLHNNELLRTYAAQSSLSKLWLPSHGTTEACCDQDGQVSVTSHIQRTQKNICTLPKTIMHAAHTHTHTSSKNRRRRMRKSCRTHLLFAPSLPLAYGCRGSISSSSTCVLVGAVHGVCGVSASTSQSIGVWSLSTKCVNVTCTSE
jgi:hypothetical protein